ncbi:TonB-dependent receptor [Altererythrobacter sp. SALINAS58]|uniref:TonB-dependent receptor n=1 Tax=Alteripontixanthobacter muriae TaxID=2705546 RepID=UPI0015768B3B|nr:TonB-dependent receptor [Alteripontixanthobacter muriae]NTZ43319.1 TonB-dependent receptor [Alteripontixanthobacter muriae]
MSALLCGTALSLALVLPVHAQDSDDADAPTVGMQVVDPNDYPADDLHDRRIGAGNEIVVTAAGITQLDVLAGTTVVEGAELLRNMDGQLGEILVKIPGVSATGFSPGASRPVLRGFSGERVKVLVDGLGTIDVSNTSDDHAVSIDPLNAERIEVLRGPATLLYGSQAIGGAVNVIDKRIPLRMPNEPVHVDAIAGVDTASALRQGGVSIDFPAGENFAFHVDGSYRKTDDLEVPGFTVAPRLRAELLAEAAEEEAEEPEEAEELREAAAQRGVLPSSATETWSANAGFAMFANGSNLGASVGIYDTNYEVPGRPGTGHAHGEEEHVEHEGEEHEEGEGGEQVSIGLRQYRADFRGSLDLGDGFFSELKTRAGYSDYTHTEFEGAEVGTVFEVQGIETRAELVQRGRDNWNGSIGFQYYFRDFDAFGAEAYVPRNRTDQYAVFGLQEVTLGPVQLEFAGRYESTDVESAALGIQRHFNGLSGAVGVVRETDAGLRFGINASRAERAPSAEELFSNGPHIATQAFEIGDVNLSTESALGLEGFMRGRFGDVQVSVAVFRSWFDDYIYLSDTGLEEDDLPVFQYLQHDATYSGVEGEMSFPLFERNGIQLLADLRGDYIHAELDDGSPLPRIPPFSLLGALEASTQRFDGRVEVQYNGEQNRTATFETATDDFTFVNASLAWKPLRGQDNVTLLAQVNNIFDAQGRRHASFTKDFVPLAGRNFKLTLQSSF